MRPLLHPSTADLELTSVMAALSDSVRVTIVRELAERGEIACGTLELDVSDATRSHHLRVLREAGLTQTRPEGTRRYVSLRREAVNERFPGLLDVVLAAAGYSSQPSEPIRSTSSSRNASA